MAQKIIWIIFFACATTAVTGWRNCAGFKDILEYNKCVKLLLKEMVPHLIGNGIPEANIPVLEPIDFDEMLVQYKFPLFQVRANLSGMRMSHVLGNYILKDIWVNPKNLTANVKMLFPSVRTEVGYDVSGKFIVLPVTSVGHFDGNFTDNLMDLTINCREIVDENNVKRIALDKVQLKLTTSDVKTNFKTPPKFRTIGNALQSFINAYPKTALSAGLPFVEKNTEVIVKSIMERILKTFRKDELVPS